MAHEITVKDTFGEVRAQGQRAWHGLGVELPEGLGAWEAFEYVKLNWETELFTPILEIDGKRVEMTNFRGHVRKDTKEVLGMVGAGYKPISNRNLADFADSLVGADAAIRTETAGSLRQGRVVFCLVKLPQTIEVTNQDILNQYVLLSNSHDGSSQFLCHPTSVRVVCANTLRMSEGDAYKGIRFHHSGDVETKLMDARQALGIVTRANTRFADDVKMLAKLNLTKAKIKAYFTAVYYKSGFPKITDDLPDEEKARRTDHLEKTLKRWMELMDNEKQSLPGIKGTAWAAYNAVSEWHDHERGRYKDLQQSDARVYSNLFGVSHLGKQASWKQALALAK